MLNSVDLSSSDVIESKIYMIQTEFIDSLAMQLKQRETEFKSIQAKLLSELIGMVYGKGKVERWSKVFQVSAKTLREQRNFGTISAPSAVIAFSTLVGHLANSSPLAIRVRTAACIDALKTVIDTFPIFAEIKQGIPLQSLTETHWSVSCSLAERFLSRFSERDCLHSFLPSAKSAQDLKNRKLELLLTAGISEFAEFSYEEDIDEVLREIGVVGLSGKALSVCHSLVVPAMIVVVALEEFFSLYKKQFEKDQATVLPKPLHFSELMRIAGELPESRLEGHYAPAGSFLVSAISGSSVAWLVLSLVVLVSVMTGFYSVSQNSSRAGIEKENLNRIGTELLSKFALSLERPQTLLENSRKLRRQHARISVGIDSNMNHSRALLEIMDIQEECARHGQFRLAISRIDGIIDQVVAGKFQEYTLELYIVSQMAKAFLELEHGVDEPQFERTNHVMSSIVSCLSALEKLNPECLISIDNRIHGAGANDFSLIDFRQRLVDFRGLRNRQLGANVEGLGQLLEKETQDVIELRLLATLAVAFHKFNLKESLADETHLYRDAVWEELLGDVDFFGKAMPENRFDIDSMTNGTVGKIPTHLHEDCRTLLCSTLVNVGIRAKCTRTPDIQQVQNIFERALVLAKGDSQSRSHVYCNRADFYLTLRRSGQFSTEANQKWLELEIGDRVRIVDLLLKEQKFDRSSSTASRALRENFYRLALAFESKGDIYHSVLNVERGNHGPSKFIVKNDVTTIQLCEDVQLNLVEKLKVCFLTLMSNHDYDVQFIHRRVRELLNQKIDDKNTLLKRFSESEKAESDRINFKNGMEDLRRSFNEIHQFLDRLELDVKIVKDTKGRVIAEISDIEARLRR